MVRVAFRPLVLRVFLGMTPLRSHQAAARARAVATQNCQSWRGKVNVPLPLARRGSAPPIAS